MSVDAGGDVSRIEPLREAPAFSEAFQPAVRGWSFAPARVEGEAGRVTGPRGRLVSFRHPLQPTRPRSASQLAPAWARAVSRTGRDARTAVPTQSCGEWAGDRRGGG